MSGESGQAGREPGASGRAGSGPGSRDEGHQPSEAARRILAELEDLLEAERAGARVTMPTATDPGSDDGRELVARVHRDEVRWCGVLMAAIRRLGGTPGTRTGDFHGKAMAIEDLDARLRFLNRGQAWVVRRLEALLPRIDSVDIATDLQAMLDAHRDNIARTEAWLARRPADAS